MAVMKSLSPVIFVKLVNQRQVEKVDAQWRGGRIPICPKKRCWIELIEGDDSDEEIFSVEM